MLFWYTGIIVKLVKVLYPIPGYPITVAIILYVCCSHIHCSRSWVTINLIRVLVWIPYRWHYNNTTPDRISPCFGTKVRFSDAFLVSHRIIKRQRMKKYTCCCCLSRWCGVQSSHLLSLKLLLSSFWLSVHLCKAMQFISEFTKVNLSWNRMTWQAQTIISYFALISTEKLFCTLYACDPHTACKPIIIIIKTLREANWRLSSCLAAKLSKKELFQTMWYSLITKYLAIVCSDELIEQ